jgi:adenylosuccinate lyase
MPHKHNPVLCENLTGLARVVRSYVIPALENISLWQERDISHSSVERIILPDAFNLIHFMLKRFAYIISGLNINIETINAHLIADNSQDKLLDFIKQGYGRQEAYRMVQGK